MFDAKEKDWKDMTQEERGRYLRKEHDKNMQNREKVIKELEAKKHGK